MSEVVSPCERGATSLRGPRESGPRGPRMIQFLRMFPDFIPDLMGFLPLVASLFAAQST